MKRNNQQRPESMEKYFQAIHWLRVNVQNIKRVKATLSEDLYMHFSKEDTEMANWFMKRHSTLLLIKWIKTETTNLASYGIC